jgi:hypothetical protein
VYSELEKVEDSSVKLFGKDKLGSKKEYVGEKSRVQLIDNSSIVGIVPTRKIDNGNE